MTEAVALDAPRPVTGARLEQFGLYALCGAAGALLFSIFVAEAFLAIAAVCWIGLLVVGGERPEAPSFFWPLVMYAAATLASAALSGDPRTSLIDSKQLVWFLLVPITYRLARGGNGSTLLTFVLSCAAVGAIVGIFQYSILHYDHLGQRPQGTLGHWMTYSGLLMIVIGVALARVLFGRGERTWPALVIPALAVAVALTFTRSAVVGVCAMVALLFSLKDFRLFAIVPVVAAVFFALAPASVSQRFVSMFDRKDPTVSDRITMLHIGARMIRAHPLAGVGPNMVEQRYVEYHGQDPLGGPDGVVRINPHLHNNAVQIAAERGLPALVLWLWFIVALIRDAWTRFARGAHRALAATALATIVALLTAGLFEYNFGDSEVLMLFLIIVTLPAAAEAAWRSRAA